MPYLSSETRTWILVVIVVIYTIVLVLHLRETKRLRAKVKASEMEREKAQTQARQKNYAGQIRNSLKRLIRDLDPTHTRLNIDTHELGDTTQIRVVDKQLRHLPYIMWINVDLTTCNEQAPFVLISMSGPNKEYGDSQLGVGQAIVDATKVVTDYAIRVLDYTPVRS